MIIFTPDLILPATYGAGTATMEDTETVLDSVTHVSTEYQTVLATEKVVTVMAIEVVNVAAPGDLWCWIELSPLPSANRNDWVSPNPTSSLMWGAIGGGGGALTPSNPTIITATGVNNTVHNIILPWTVHSQFARLVVQQPTIAGATDGWAVQGWFSGRS